MGPLQGVRVVELAGIGPGPFCGMMLADMGADVLRVDRKGGAPTLAGLVPPEKDILNRGRRSVALDLKQPAGVEAALVLLERADALVEGFRPGVMERLGLGPAVCAARNPRLVYGRMTGWGQDGPLAGAAGHDINYIAVAGALGAIGSREGGPVPPLNLVGDFGGGAMLLAFGVVCALLEARTSGHGQVVDAAMIDGTALLMAQTCSLRAAGLWEGRRGDNVLDGGAPYYTTYECADGRWLAVGALEPRFHALLLEKCGLDDPALRAQGDRARWPEAKARLASLFRTRSRDEWCALLEGTDACVSPILDLDEAPGHPHNRARGVFRDVGGLVQPAPAPRFSRTVPELDGPHAAVPDADTVLAGWGVPPEQIASLRQQGAI